MKKNVWKWQSSKSYIFTQNQKNYHHIAFVFENDMMFEQPQLMEGEVFDIVCGVWL